MNFRGLFISWLLAFPLLAMAADVRMKRLEEFDIETHRMTVNVEQKAPSNCLAAPRLVESAHSELLGTLGFQLGSFDDSQLEFAVSVKGFNTSGPQSCGLRVISMVRQVPVRKILRISPGSESRQYRLWTAENLVTGHESEMKQLLEQRATQDVFDFFEVYQRSRPAN